VKGTVKRTSLVPEVRRILGEISNDLHAKANRKLADSIETIDDLSNLPKKILRFGWCGSEDCGHEFENRTELKLLGTPYKKEKFAGKCIICGAETDMAAYGARAM
jgi:prolyl-tRNA synthetase